MQELFHSLLDIIYLLNYYNKVFIAKKTLLMATHKQVFVIKTIFIHSTSFYATFFNSILTNMLVLMYYYN